MARRRAPPKHPESDFQIQLIKAYDWMAIAEAGILFAVPNGEKRDKITSAILAALGVRPGVSDLVLVARSGVWFIEVKNPALKPPFERYLSADQVKFRDHVVSLGHKYRICASFEVFSAILQEAGVGKSVTFGPSGVPFVAPDTPAARFPPGK